MSNKQPYEKLNHLTEADQAKLKARLKQRACLNCDRKFESHGPNNRLCVNCRNISRG